jgi:hypothetical protein
MNKDIKFAIKTQAIRAKLSLQCLIGAQRHFANVGKYLCPQPLRLHDKLFFRAGELLRHRGNDGTGKMERHRRPASPWIQRSGQGVSSDWHCGFIGKLSRLDEQDFDPESNENLHVQISLFTPSFRALLLSLCAKFRTTENELRTNDRTRLRFRRHYRQFSNCLYLSIAAKRISRDTTFALPGLSSHVAMV